jgi:hypothetical protein
MDKHTSPDSNNTLMEAAFLSPAQLTKAFPADTFSFENTKTLLAAHKVSHQLDGDDENPAWLLQAEASRPLSLG